MARPRESPLDLDRLFREHSAYVAGVVTRFLGRDSEVQDVVQDVFVEAMRDISQLRNPSAARAWLARIAVRTAGRRLRKRRLRRFLSIDEPETYERIAAPGIGPERAAQLAALYRALDELPVRLRVPWTLRHIEKHSLEEVAQLCGCSLATAKRRIRKGHQLLQRSFRDG